MFLEHRQYETEIRQEKHRDFSHPDQTPHFYHLICDVLPSLECVSDGRQLRIQRTVGIAGPHTGNDTNTGTQHRGGDHPDSDWEDGVTVDENIFL